MPWYAYALVGIVLFVILVLRPPWPRSRRSIIPTIPGDGFRPPVVPPELSPLPSVPNPLDGSLPGEWEWRGATGWVTAKKVYNLPNGNYLVVAQDGTELTKSWNRVRERGFAPRPCQRCG